jgi:cytidylate kinase
MNEILGGQPGTWNLFHKTNKTILQLAHMGYCIIVERGGNIITTKMDNCFHVRLIASAEDKIMHVMEVFNFNRKEAAEYINKEDENRKEFIQAYFHKNIEDPELYHLIVNTSEMNYEQAAELIYSTVMKNYSKYLNGDEAKTLKYLKSQ